MSHLFFRRVPIWAIAVLALYFVAPMVSADNPDLTARSFECQKHPECGTDHYWETQQVFTNQFKSTQSYINPAFYPYRFTNLKCDMKHTEIDPAAFREAMATGTVTYNC